jgi:hypothetical protein
MTDAAMTPSVVGIVSYGIFSLENPRTQAGFRILVLQWLEFSSLRSSRCKYICPRALAAHLRPKSGSNVIAIIGYTEAPNEIIGLVQ